MIERDQQPGTGATTPARIEVRPDEFWLASAVMEDRSLREQALALASRRGARRRYARLTRLFAGVDGDVITARRKRNAPQPRGRRSSAYSADRILRRAGMPSCEVLEFRPRALMADTNPGERADA